MSWWKAVRSASRESWHDAIKEVGSIAILAMIPLLLKALYYYITAYRSGVLGYTYLESFLEHVAAGDLLLFSVANFAVIFWLASQDYEDTFEERIWFNLVSVIGIGICSFFIGLDPEFNVAPLALVQGFAISSFLVSLFCNIQLLMFQHYNSGDFNALQNTEDHDAARNLRRRRLRK
jgi:hypothetical protein